jgi:hypothetical protein
MYIQKANTGAMPSDVQIYLRGIEDQILQIQMCCAAKRQQIIW